MLKKARFTTANYLNPDFDSKYTFYIGTDTGSLKRINPSIEDAFNVEKIDISNTETRTTSITCLECDRDDSDTLIIGRTNDVVDVYNVRTKVIASVTKSNAGPVVGLSTINSDIIVAAEKGEICKIDRVSLDSSSIGSGDHFSKMRHCVEDNAFIATGGKGNKNSLRVWDIEKKMVVHTSKNVPHDSLELEVPIWDNDFRFLNKFTLASCSRHGYVRLYDFRQQPAISTQNKDFLFYVGTTTGGIRGFDSRMLKRHVHTYKGATGGINDITIDPKGKYMYSTSLDRYVRIYSTESTVLEYQCYIKSKPSQILLDLNNHNQRSKNITTEDESEPQKVDPDEFDTTKKRRIE